MIEKLEKYNCNELYIKQDSESGCTFVVAMNTIYHDRGNGGTRMKQYSSIDEGIEDALKLANAMTKKCVIIGNENNGSYSGAKGVIIGNPKTQKTPQMLRNYGKFVQSLKGKFQTGCDMNIFPKDLEYMSTETQYVDGLPKTALGDSGDATAFGIIVAMKVLCGLKYGNASLRNRIIAIQGIGSVGSSLVRRLTEEGAKIIVTDIDVEKLNKIVKKYGLKKVTPKKIYSVQCDIFSPNACGEILTDKNIKKLKCDLIIGGANNPLSKGLESIKQLQKKGILFAPDYIVNIGAQILAICEVQGKRIDYAYTKISEIIQKRLKQIALKRGTLYENAERLVHLEMKIEKN
jgi:leucine dehydrogenase